MRTLTAAILAAFLAATPVAAQDIEKDEKLVGKLAVPASSLGDDPKARGLCVCLDDGTADSVGGVGILSFQRLPVTLGRKIHVVCHVYQYDTNTGERVASDACELWTALPK
jgi:hypothetical protein